MSEIQSMTGYGHGRAPLVDDYILLDLTALNHKSREIRLNLPPELQKLEPHLTRIIGSMINRGTINLVMRLQSGEKGSGLTGRPRVSRRRLRELVRELREAALDAGISDHFSIGDLLGLPEIVAFEPEDIPAEELRQAADKALRQALDELIRERCREGAELAQELIQRGEKLNEIMDRIDKLRDSAMKNYQERLQQRISLMRLELAADDDRLVKEVAFAAQRTDITEEMTRLRAHLEQFLRLLRHPEPPVGRKLMFLCQEIHRESNTIGAKTGETKISRLVLDFKAELEKIREQCWNVE